MSSSLNQNLYRRQMFKNLCQVGMNICKPIPKPMTIIIQIHVPKHNFFFIKPVPKRIFNGIYYTSKRMDNILKPITKRVPGTYHQICTKRATDISRARVRTICYKNHTFRRRLEKNSCTHQYICIRFGTYLRISVRFGIGLKKSLRFGINLSLWQRFDYMFCTFQYRFEVIYIFWWNFGTMFTFRYRFLNIMYIFIFIHFGIIPLSSKYVVVQIGKYLVQIEEDLMVLVKI